MKTQHAVIALLFLGAFGSTAVWAQGITPQVPCTDANNTDAPIPESGACTGAGSMMPGQFQAVPLIDGAQQDYGDPDHNIVSLYGAFGNNENASSSQAAKDHYQKGITSAANITPRCADGTPSTTTCSDGSTPAIVFLFIGFSNCTIEVCGGNTDAWAPMDSLPGQPCASSCPNLDDPNHTNAWNDAGDGVTQMSLLRQVYPDNNPSDWLVGPHVVLWDGAEEGQTLAKWDPTSNGYYDHHNTCKADPYNQVDPECDYYAVKKGLNGNGFSEAQVQAVFIKTSDSYPVCDLKGTYCTGDQTMPDAYQSEIYLGDIVRYLKCCTLNAQHQSTGIPRYPNLQQVFVTSRTYGGYANGQPYGQHCLMPEPYAYEEGFAVQRLIVSQIQQADGGQSYDDYTGELDYSVAPWVDWGSYLWASGETNRSDALNWCNGQNDDKCQGRYDIRQGDTSSQENQAMYWGDYTHPNANGTQKVANLLVNFITTSPWVVPWIRK